MELLQEVRRFSPAMVAAQATGDRFAEAVAVREFMRQVAPPPRNNGGERKGLLTMFFEKVVCGASECWYWIGALDGNGYGMCSPDCYGESRAHRAAWRLLVGEIPDGMDVLHECDVRSCVNPADLFLGTQAENVADMVAKGRNRPPVLLCGEENPGHRLTRTMVEELRAAYAAGGVSMKALGERFGVSPMTIQRAVARKTWRGGADADE